VDLIVASPLKRTIYTALYSLEKIIASKDLTIIALPEIQETSDLPCDTGSDVAELKHEFEGKKIDYSLVKEDWNSKKGKWAPTTKEIEERCKTARKWLMERKEEHIVVVTHGGVLHYLTEDWSGFEGFMGESKEFLNNKNVSVLTQHQEPDGPTLNSAPTSLSPRKPLQHHSERLKNPAHAAAVQRSRLPKPSNVTSNTLPPWIGRRLATSTTHKLRHHRCRRVRYNRPRYEKTSG